MGTQYFNMTDILKVILTSSSISSPRISLVFKNIITLNFTSQNNALKKFCFAKLIFAFQFSHSMSRNNLPYRLILIINIKPMHYEFHYFLLYFNWKLLNLSTKKCFCFECQLLIFFLMFLVFQRTFHYSIKNNHLVFHRKLFLNYSRTFLSYQRILVVSKISLKFKEQKASKV
jgi:hypothetical protein